MAEHGGKGGGMGDRINLSCLLVTKNVLLERITRNWVYIIRNWVYVNKHVLNFGS